MNYCNVTSKSWTRPSGRATNKAVRLSRQVAIYVALQNKNRDNTRLWKWHHYSMTL